jgi:cytochrome o ubiquinol oxidase subunit 2
MMFGNYSRHNPNCTSSENVRMIKKIPSALLAIPVLLLLSGCNLVVMNPSGDVAIQQRDLIITSTVLMLLIIVPVIVLTLFFAWKYRESAKAEDYDPEWHHSTRLEMVIWSAPVAIILMLGTVTWISTHRLDPYRPLERIDENRQVTAETKPITVEVVAMDWKWLFFYPELGIGSVNEFAAPVDVPINFKITGTTAMNSFFVPALAGQIYAMGGMQTKLHAVINKEGVYDGFSANFSGPGFSHMRFKFHGLSQQGFDQWVAKAKEGGKGFGRQEYLEFAKPSEREPVQYFASVDPELYSAILNRCVEPNKLCMRDMMHIDAKGGGGKEGIDIAKALNSVVCTPLAPYGVASGPQSTPAAIEGQTFEPAALPETKQVAG